MARPKGSTNKLEIKGFIGAENIEKLTNKAITMALDGNEQMMKFLLEHIYGKAPQPVTGEDGGPVVFEIINYGQDKDTLQLGTGTAPTTDTSGQGEVQGDSLASQST